MLEPSGSVAVAGPAVRLMTACANVAPLASRRTEAASPDLIRHDLRILNRIAVLPDSYIDSSITNSRESTSIIMNIPPGNTLLVVISRSLCECHIKA